MANMMKRGVSVLHWVMWVFWGSVVTLFVGSYLVDFLTGRKYDFKEQENTYNQNSAIADSQRDVVRRDHQDGLY